MWEPIARVDVNVRGVDREAAGLLDVEIELNRDPPAEWARFFDRGANVGRKVSMHPPRLLGSTVRVRPPDDEIEAYVKHVDDLVQSCNENYAKEQLPQIEARDEAKQNAAQAAEDRLAEAQRRADLL